MTSLAVDQFVCAFADRQRKRQGVLRRLLMNGGHGLHVSPQRIDIGVRHLGVRGIGHGGVEELALLVDPVAQRPHEFGAPPGADAGRLVGGDVRAINLAERRRERRSAAVQQIRLAMAGDTIRGPRHVLPSFDESGGGGRRGGTDGERAAGCAHTEQGGQQLPQRASARPRAAPQRSGGLRHIDPSLKVPQFSSESRPPARRRKPQSGVGRIALSDQGLIHQAAQLRAIARAARRVRFLEHENADQAFCGVDPKVGSRGPAPVEIADRSRHR